MCTDLYFRVSRTELYCWMYCVHRCIVGSRGQSCIVRCIVYITVLWGLSCISLYCRVSCTKLYCLLYIVQRCIVGCIVYRAVLLGCTGLYFGLYRVQSCIVGYGTQSCIVGCIVYRAVLFGCIMHRTVLFGELCTELYCRVNCAESCIL